jgi:UDP-glucuronate 4-epimerase
MNNIYDKQAAAGRQRILVTGAAGFIGSFTAARLAQLGHDVTGCDSFNNYYDPGLKHQRVRELLAPRGVPCLEVNLADNERAARLFDDVRPTLVVHLAAQAGVRYSLRNPSACIQSNLLAFGHVLEACRQHEVQHLVYASSSSIYGANTVAPFREDASTDAPVSLYAATKKANELMAHAYSQLYSMPATGVRLFTAYGPWGRPDMAYFSFTEKIVKGEPIPVFAEGELRRDFTYIDDIVEGIVRLLFKPQPGGGKPPHAIFNIGNNSPVRVLDFIGALEALLNTKARIQHLPMQPGDVPLTYAATDKMRAWVGVTPLVPLTQGLQRFVDWYLPWSTRRASSDTRLMAAAMPAAAYTPPLVPIID